MTFPVAQDIARHAFLALLLLTWLGIFAREAPLDFATPADMFLIIWDRLVLGRAGQAAFPLLHTLEVAGVDRRLGSKRARPGAIFFAGKDLLSALCWISRFSGGLVKGCAMLSQGKALASDSLLAGDPMMMVSFLEDVCLLSVLGA
jgi:hypothetical protein